MSLKLILKPKEKVIIGGAVIQNTSDKKSEISILNDVTLLREKDIIREEEALTPATRIYFVVQLMYMSGSLYNSKNYHKRFFELTHQFLSVCPNEYIADVIAEIGYHILNENFYKALKECKYLIDYEIALMH